MSRVLVWLGLVLALVVHHVLPGLTPLPGLLLPAVVLALVVLLVTARSRARTAGLWLAVAAVGQAAALQLIDAGTRLHYQHTRTLDRMLDESGRRLKTDHKSSTK